MINAHGFPPNQVGGGEWRAYRTALRLQARGHSVRVIAIDDINHRGSDLVVKEEQVDDIDVVRLSFDKSRVQNWEFQNQLIGDCIANRLKNEGTDIFHLISGARNTGSVIQAACQENVPVVVSLTEFYWICPRNTLLKNTGELCPGPDSILECSLCLFNRQLNKKVRYSVLDKMTYGICSKVFLMASQNAYFRKKIGIPEKTWYLRYWLNSLRTTLLQANKLIAPSQFLMHMYTKSGIPERLFALCRQGVDTSLWESVPEDEYRGPLRFGFVGNLVPHKGTDILLKSFGRLNSSNQSSRLNVFGSLDKNLDYGDRLRNLAKNDQHISFRGEFDYRNVPKVFSEIDVLVVPSVWYENSPNVILEAYACKTPVIASDIGGMAELVQKGITGDLFRVGDVEDLANLMCRITKNPAILKNWRDRIPRVKQIDDEMDDLEAIYSSAVCRPK
jgi:glycosyltransferase involved in cell wall biosynthesis